MKKILILLLFPVLAFSQEVRWQYNPTTYKTFLYIKGYRAICLYDSLNTSSRGFIKFYSGTAIFNALRGTGLGYVTTSSTGVLGRSNLNTDVTGIGDGRYFLKADDVISANSAFKVGNQVNNNYISFYDDATSRKQLYLFTRSFDNSKLAYISIESQNSDSFIKLTSNSSILTINDNGIYSNTVLQYQNNYATAFSAVGARAIPDMAYNDARYLTTTTADANYTKVLKTFKTIAVNTGSTETDLQSYTIPANTLADGETVVFISSITAAGSGGQYNIYLKNINYYGVFLSSGNRIISTVTMTRDGSNANYSIAITGSINNVQNSTITFDATVANIIKVTGQGTTTNDLTAYTGNITKLPFK